MNYHLVFDGKNIVGLNLCDVIYLWTDRGVPCYVGMTMRGIHTRIGEHIAKGTVLHKKLTKRPEDFRCYIIDHYYDSKNQDMSHQQNSNWDSHSVSIVLPMDKRTM